jgi:hypothetical protein
MNAISLLFRRICLVLVLVTVCGSLISCKKKEEAPAPASAPAPEAADSDGETDVSLEKGQGAPAAKRKIILNHAITLEVKSVGVSLEALKQLAESSGGYVFNSTRSGNESGSVSGQVGMRIPSGKANAVMKSIRGMGRVESENSTAEDITEEYVDLEARLKNAKSSEARLLELYSKAGKLSDVLAVEKELTRVRGDIESFEAKKKNWDILTAMVTIEITLHEPSGGFPSGHRFWSTIKGAFGKSADVVADSLHALIVFVAGVLPWLAVFGPIVYLLVKWRRKKKREKIERVGNEEARRSEAELKREEGE